MRPDDLLCSPNAHARSIVFLDRRCSSKRALGGQSVLPLRKMEKPQEVCSSLGKAHVSTCAGWEGEKARSRRSIQPRPEERCERAWNDQFERRSFMRARLRLNGSP